MTDKAVVFTDITPEITVYRYSPEKALDTLKAKVTRLNTAAVFEGSRTLVRALARDGLMDDGKESLLECRSFNHVQDFLADINNFYSRATTRGLRLSISVRSTNTLSTTSRIVRVRPPLSMLSALT